MKDNGKVSIRVSRRFRVRLTFRIQDPDGVADYWIYKLDNNGNWQPWINGIGGCNKDVLINVIIGNWANASRNYKVTYKDCQPTPAYEVWENKTSDLNGWYDGYKKDSGYEPDRFTPEEEFPEHIPPVPWWQNWWWLLGAVIILSSIGFYIFSSDDD